MVTYYRASPSLVLEAASTKLADESEESKKQLTKNNDNKSHRTIKLLHKSHSFNNYPRQTTNHNNNNNNPHSTKKQCIMPRIMVRQKHKGALRAITITACAAILASLASSGALQVAAANNVTNQNNINNNLTAQLIQTSTINNNDMQKQQANNKTELGPIQQEQQQQVDSADSSELNSMYVQIPVAEPLEGMTDSAQSKESDATQQQLLESAEQAAAGDSRWSGPWARKFQIGYIKQSDLHQVLMESLKQEPFTSLTAPNDNQQQVATNNHTKSGQQATKSAAPPSDNSSLMSPVKSAARQLLPAIQSNSGSGLYGPPQQAQRSQQPLATPAAFPERPGPFFKGPTNPAYRPNQMVPSHHQQTAAVAHMQQQQQHQRFPFQRQQNSQLAGHHQAQNFLNQAPFAANNYRQVQVAHSAGPFRAPQNQHQFNANNNNPFRPQQQHNNPMPLYGMPMGPIGPPPPPLQPPMAQQFQFGPAPMSFKNQPIYTTITQQQQQPQLDLNNNNFAPETPSIPRPLNQKSASNIMDIMNMNLGSSIPGSNRWKPVTTQQTQNDLADFDDGFNPPASPSSVSSNQAQQQAIKSPGSDSTQQSSSSSMNRHPALNSYLQQTGRASPTMIYRNQTQSASQSSPSGKSARGAKGFVPQMKISDVPAKGGVPSSSNSSARPNTRKTPSTNSTQTSVSNDEESQSTTPANTPSSTQSSAVTTETETQDPESETVDTTDSDDSTTTTTPTSNPASDSTTATPSLLAAGAGQAKSGADASSTSAPGPSSSASPAATTTTDSGIDSEVVTQPSSSTTSSTTSAAPPATSDGTSSTSSGQREETTPSSSTQRGVEVEGGKASASDEALMANAIRAEIDKSSNGQQKRARSSERLQRQQQQPAAAAQSQVKGQQQQQQQRAKLVSPVSKVKPKSQQQQAGSTKSGKVAAGASKSGPREFGAKGGRGTGNTTTSTTTNATPVAGSRSPKSARVVTSSTGATSATTSTTRSPKITRMAAGAAREPASSSEQPIAQVVRMTDAQALSTAQTLASILMSRCMMSTNCAHLLDVCSTKQASFSLPTQEQISASNQDATMSRPANWSLPVGLGSQQLLGLAASLQADRVLRLFPLWRETIETLIDGQEASGAGYSLLLPSNEAVEQLGGEQVQAWNSSPELLSQIIDNHILEAPETFSLNGMPQATGQPPRAPKSRYVRPKSLQVNQHRDRMITLNGKRLIYANQLAPAGGRLHVIDGILDWQSLWTSGPGRALGPAGSDSSAASSPATTDSSGAGNALAATQMPDILDTLKRCDKFDGFVTLVEGTGLAQILKQDGPLTVFVPSNEALRRIPDEELEVIKNNSTALKEFLMYHVVNGSFFSQDLRDGQQVNSILNAKPIQVGVRVDGCTRRLVEANTSPMRRADIPAKNGVIHILDWYLTAQDNDWCDPLTFSASRNPVSTAAADASSTAGGAFSGNSLAESGSAPVGMQVQQNSPSSFHHQQARHSSASLWSQDYATRLTMPANHKLEQHATQASTSADAEVAAAATTTYLDEQQVAINEQLQHQQAINRIGMLSSNSASTSNSTSTNDSGIGADLTNTVGMNDLTRQTAPSDSLSRRA